MALKSWSELGFPNHFLVHADKKSIPNPPQKFTQTVIENKII